MREELTRSQQPPKRFGQSLVKGVCLLAAVLLFVSCSNDELNGEVDEGLEVGEDMENDVPVEVTDDVHEQTEVELQAITEVLPPSTFVISKVKRSRVVTTQDLEVSQTERELLDTLEDFNAVTVEKSTTLTLPDNILFDFDSAELQDEADDVIDQIVQVIEASEGEVHIAGHTDNTGDPAYNLDLSEQRAQSVLEALVDKGIDEKRLHAEGFGETKPVARNTFADGSDDPQGRQKNRRVEVTVQGLSLE